MPIVTKTYMWVGSCLRWTQGVYSIWNWKYSLYFLLLRQEMRNEHQLHPWRYWYSTWLTSIHMKLLFAYLECKFQRYFCTMDEWSPAPLGYKYPFRSGAELHFNFLTLWINEFPLSVAVMSPVNIAIIPCLKSTKCACMWMLCACVYGTDKSKSSASQYQFIFLLKLVWLEIVRAWVWKYIGKYCHLRSVNASSCLSFFLSCTPMPIFEQGLTSLQSLLASPHNT